MGNISHKKYKGFEIEFFIDGTGFNQYNITIKNYRYEGTKREEYFLKMIDTYTNKKSEAWKIAKEYIDNLKTIKWSSQGLSKIESLPD